jgi:hypothetical protein
LGHVALDGTKLQANASVHKAMSYARMREAENKLAAEVSAWFVQQIFRERAETERVAERGAAWNSFRQCGRAEQEGAPTDAMRGEFG